ncbi:alpha/beta hydrolase-fold protein [Cytophagales bacterium LB-30]|uniref:Alpha/beta hydrolase-fold protein n=1 Tax=Shiella aurantiaca TaxID=3058365 RepID=A0ABT8F5K8_9BACT|nr:alpha/beta hydrolase-fold protein [Shiella aurantiaca]MDN4165534.1 alpha/beta hydrolase-fold protein [Shiella aurantiaca]
MKKHLGSLFVLILLSMPALWAQNPLPVPQRGKIERIANFSSAYVSARHVDIWLPPNYSDTAKHAVLYMHDGQMLFDASLTWNQQSWEVDEVASALLENKQVRPFIVVGIWNGGNTRHSDYFPQKPFDALSAAEKDTVSAQLRASGRGNGPFLPKSDNYLKFLVEELKPYIDTHYSVYTDKDNTFIAGSSMGGLISLYAFCEYPEVFGGAACLSTHWVGTFQLANNPVPAAFLKYLEQHVPSPPQQRLYFDYGDQTLDALYPAIQQQADSVLRAKGYGEAQWRSLYFPGEDHSERAWSRRLATPLLFLLGE